MALRSKEQDEERFEGQDNTTARITAATFSTRSSVPHTSFSLRCFRAKPLIHNRSIEESVRLNRLHVRADELLDRHSRKHGSRCEPWSDLIALAIHGTTEFCTVWSRIIA